MKHQFQGSIPFRLRPWPSASALFVLWLSVTPLASASKVSKLATECFSKKNSQACDELKAIATNPNEKTRERLEAIATLHDPQTLSGIAESQASSEITNAAEARLKQVVIELRRSLREAATAGAQADLGIENRQDFSERTSFLDPEIEWHEPKDDRTHKKYS